MTKQEINKYLTETIGECWHELEKSDLGLISRCKHCDLILLDCRCNPAISTVRNNDFFSSEGFFKLWDWAQNQEWFGDCLLWISSVRVTCGTCGEFPSKMYHEVSDIKEIINPDRFATSVYEFLKTE